MELWDDYDHESKGYLRPDQLQTAYREIFDNEVWHGQLNLVMQTYSDKNKLRKKNFEGALRELNRRCCLEQSLYWDYQSISNYSDRKLNIEEAVLLTQIAHGDYFSVKNWKMFMKSRPIKSAPISWNDIRVFLCTTPEESDNNNEEIKTLKLNLRKNEIDGVHKKGIRLETEQTINLRREIELETNRLIRVYHKYGAMAVIFDDGKDPDDHNIDLDPQKKKTQDFDAAWVKLQMTEEEWRRLSEKERQMLLMRAKLLERQLLREMYGDEWWRERDRLEQDAKKLTEAERLRRLEFQRRLALRLANANRHKEIPDLTSMGDVIPEEAELEKIEDNLTADWVKLQMDEEEWRKLSEKERQDLLLKAKMAQRALRQEMYGEEWMKQLESLQGNEDAIAALRKRQRDEFYKRLAAALSKQDSTNNSDVSELHQLENTFSRNAEDEKLENKLSADWVKKQMSEEEWRRLTEKEKQALILKAKLAQRSLRQEMYGSEWLSQLEQLEGNEAKLADLRRRRIEEFEARLAAAFLQKAKKDEVSHLTEFRDMIPISTEEENTESILTADWVKRQMDEEEWRRLTDKEKQEIILKAKLAQRALRQEMYGSDWIARLKELEGNEEKLAEMKRLQREEFDRRLAANIFQQKNNDQVTELTDLGNKTPTDTTEDELETVLTADWVKAQMDKEEWHRLSEKEKQEQILQAKIAQRALRRDMYGDDWLQQIQSLQNDEEKILELKKRQKAEFDKRLAAALFRKGKPEHLSEIGDQRLAGITEEEEEELCADWVKAEMSKKHWDDMTEKQRQEYMLAAKLEQRRLRDEMYSEAWHQQLAELAGDQEAIQKAKENQRKLFNERLKALLLLKHNLFDYEDDNDENNDIIMQLCYNWIHNALGVDYWNLLNESERIFWIQKVKIAQEELKRQIYCDSFGDNWETVYKNMKSDVSELKAFQVSKHDQFNQRLASIFSTREDQKTELELMTDGLINSANEHVLCSKFAETVLTPDQWKKIGKDKQQELITELVKRQSVLQTKMYGIEWIKTLCKISGNAKNIETSKITQITEFEKCLLAAIKDDELDANLSILQKIVHRKYQFIEAFEKSESITFQKNAELAFVSSVNVDDVIYVFIDNLFEISLASCLEEIQAINFLIINFDNDNMAVEFGHCLVKWLVAHQNRTLNLEKIDSIISDPKFSEIKEKMELVKNFLNYKDELVKSMNTVMTAAADTSAKETFGNYPKLLVDAELLQIFFRVQVNYPNQEILKNLTQKCISLKFQQFLYQPVDGFNVTSHLFSQLYKFVLEYKTQLGVLMDIPIPLTIINACFVRDRNLMRDANIVNLLDEIESKFSAIRTKILKEISKNKANNSKPAGQTKKEYEEMVTTLESMKRDRKSVTEYMMTFGVQLPSNQRPDEYFGPDIARVAGWMDEKGECFITESQILPTSDLQANDLFYATYAYEESEKAITVLQCLTSTDIRGGYDHILKIQERWHQLEMERIMRTDDFVVGTQLASLRSRKHFLPKAKLDQDGARYVMIGRSILLQESSFHPVRGADMKPKTTDRNDWKVLFFRNMHELEQHALTLMKLLLLEKDTIDIKDYAMSIDDERRTSRINEIREEKKRISDKHHNFSLLRELTAHVYANRYHTFLRCTESSSVNHIDIGAAIMGELLEYLDEIFHIRWSHNPDDYFDEAIIIQNQVKEEHETQTSKIVWDMLLDSRNRNINKQLDHELEVLKKTMRKLPKVDGQGEDELLKTLAAINLANMSEEKRQRLLMKLKIARRKEKLEGMDDMLHLMQLEDNANKWSENERSRQLLLARKRLELLKQKKNLKSVDEATEESEDFEERVAQLIAKSAQTELQYITDVIRTKKYMNTKEKSEHLIAKLEEAKDLKDAINLRLAILSENNENPEEIFFADVINKQKTIESEILDKVYNPNILDEIENRKFDATKFVVYGAGTIESVEKQLKAKYTEIRRIQIMNAIIDEITEEIWLIQNEEFRKKLIDEISAFEDIDEGVRKSALIRSLSRQAKNENRLSDKEKKELKAKRTSILNQLESNYNSEMKSIMDRVNNIENKQQAEKARQLEIIRLKREQRNLAHDELGDQVASLTREVTNLNMRREHEKSRQKKIAIERQKAILARRAKMNQAEVEKETKKQIDDLFDENKIKEKIAKVEVNTQKPIFEDIIENLELLHQNEIQIMEGLFTTAVDNKDTFSQAEKMPEKDIQKRIKKYQKKRVTYFQKWISEEMPEGSITQNVTEQLELMAKVSILKLVQESKTMKVPLEKVTVELLAQLQSIQSSENFHFEQMIKEDIDADVLRELVKLLIRARNEFWSANITSTLLFAPFDTTEGKMLADQWFALARKNVRKDIGVDLMNKKLGQLRKDAREKDQVPESLGYGGRKATIIDIKITQDDQDEYVRKLQQNLVDNERISIAGRTTYRDNLNKRIQRARESKIASEDKKHDEVVDTLHNLARDHTIFINTRRTQEADQKNKINRMIEHKKREKTIIEKQKREKTFIDRIDDEDMDKIAKKLQNEAMLSKRESTTSILIERENTEEAIQKGTGEIVEETDAFHLVRERTHMKKDRKKRSRRQKN